MRDSDGAGVPPPERPITLRAPAMTAGDPPANAVTMRHCETRGERKVSRGGTPKRAKGERSRYAGSPAKAQPRVSWRTRYAFEPSSSPASTCSTSEASTVSSIVASRTKPAYNRSNCGSESDSRSTPGVASGRRTVCRQRNRTSASRAEVTARSRKLRSISASLGGSRSRRAARQPRDPRNAGLLARGVPPASGGTGFHAGSGSSKSLATSC